MSKADLDKAQKETCMQIIFFGEERMGGEVYGLGVLLSQSDNYISSE